MNRLFLSPFKRQLGVFIDIVNFWYYPTSLFVCSAHRVDSLHCLSFQGSCILEID